MTLSQHSLIHELAGELSFSDRDLVAFARERGVVAKIEGYSLSLEATSAADASDLIDHLIEEKKRWRT